MFKCVPFRNIIVFNRKLQANNGMLTLTRFSDTFYLVVPKHFFSNLRDTTSKKMKTIQGKRRQQEQRTQKDR